MAEQKWEKKCEVCGEKVTYGALGPCKEQPGSHILEHKIYYDLGGRNVADIRDRVKYGPLVILRAAGTVVDAQNPDKRDIVPGLSVKFEGGKYGTTDAAEQYYLDRKGFPTGEEGFTAWKAIYWTPERQAQQALFDAKAANDKLSDLNRQIKESQSLLDSVKSEGKPKASGKPAMVNG